jgi:hypothetical protein
MSRNPADNFNAAFEAAGGGQGQYPFLYPTPYAPAQFGLGGGDMGALIAMFAGPLMSAAAGPDSFVPQLFPSQNLMDSYAMRNYQREMLTSSLDVSRGSSPGVAERLLGARSIFTDDPITQLNREQAQTGADILTHPLVKAMTGAMFGPERVEAAMYGSRGDVSALNSSIAKTGFFRTDPGGSGRMKADSLTAFTEGVYAHLYEPEGNLDEIETMARKKRGMNPFRNQNIDTARQQLKEAAGMPDAQIISEEEVVDRMQNMKNSNSEINRLYSKYVKNGTSTTTEEKAKELAQFDRAIKETGVMQTGEATISQLRKEADQMPTKRMRGFMAGQVGEMQQALFEQGLLPQAIGDMSAEDRMKTVGGETRATETITRLARKMARTELETSDPLFKELSREQQERLVDTKLPDAEKTLRKTEKEAQRFAAGESGAMSIEDLEKQGGMDLLSTDTDAARTGQTLEKYTGSLAAIRELFGDNGNPNAPVPALIKMMNALTNSTAGQFEPGRIEAELRKMQTLAKETGVGLNQLAALSTNVTQQGRMFGLSDATSTQATNAVLAGIQVMQKDGSFNTGRFGAMSKEQAMDTLGQQVQAGAASNNAKSMATLARLYDADSSKWTGTELEAAVEAYRDPNSEGVYVDPVSGEEKNLYEDVGTYGPGAARSVLQRAGEQIGNGGDTSAFDPIFYDPLTEEYTLDNKTAGYMTQAVVGRRVAGMYTRARVSQALIDDDTLLAGVDEDERFRRGEIAGDVIAQMLIDTGDMPREKRNKEFKARLEGEIAEKLKDRGVPDAEADASAKELASRYNDPSQIETLAGGASAVIAERTGLNLTSAAQLYGRGKAHDMAQEGARAADRAEAKKQAGLGYESTPIARASDYLAELNKSGKRFTASGLLDALMPTMKDSEVARKYMSKMEPGWQALQERMDGVFVTDSHIDELAANKDYGALMQLADPKGRLQKDGTRVISGKELDRARNAAIDTRYRNDDGTFDEDSISAEYTRAGLGRGAGLSAQEKIAELKQNETFMGLIDRDVRDSQNAITEDQLIKEAREQKGYAFSGQEAAAERINKIQASFIAGKDAEKTKAGVTAAFREFDVKMDEDQIKKYHRLILDSSEGGKRKLNEAIDEDMSGYWAGINAEDRENLRSILNAQQEAVKLDPAGMGISEKSGGMTEKTKDGVVDKTQIDAQTVVLQGVRYVDDNGREVPIKGGRANAEQHSPSVRDRAMEMVEEHYSASGWMGNSTPFSDAEVGDAAGMLADELGISQESAKEVMKGIQTERAGNATASTIVSWFTGDNLPHAEKKAADQERKQKDRIAPEQKAARERAPTPDKEKEIQEEQAKESVRQTSGVSYETLDREKAEAMIKQMAEGGLSHRAIRNALVDAGLDTALGTGMESTTSVGSGAGGFELSDFRQFLADPNTLVSTGIDSGREGGISLMQPDIRQFLADPNTMISTGMTGISGVSSLEQASPKLASRDVESAQATQNKELKVTGTLSLQGLQEAMLAARGDQATPTEGGGAPIVGDPSGVYSSMRSGQT